MKLTSLLAAAFFLAATALAAVPTASAFCIQTGRSAAVVCGDNVTRTADEAIGLAIGVVGVAVGVAQDNLEDLDGDGVPDVAEPVLCSNTFVNGLVNQPSVPGDCLSTSNYLPPNDLAEALGTVAFYSALAQSTVNGAVAELQGDIETIQGILEGAVAFVESQVDPVVASVDGDHDNVADVLEPIICGFVEFKFTTADGSCDAATNSDYTPPA